MHAQTTLSMIAARGRNGVIGASGTLPWRLKTDMAHFRKLTMGKPVIMGRKTWESLPSAPLKGRENIVVSRDWTFDAPGARVYTNVVAALNAAKAIAARSEQGEAFVIGGEAIYAAALPYADRLYLTDVDAAPAGDAWFPDFVVSEWRETASTSCPAGPDDDHAFKIRTLDRIHVHALPNKA
jgi:dihydrofolate reductase